jgi:hypothetical protein
MAVTTAFATPGCMDPTILGVTNTLTPGFSCTLGPLLFSNFQASPSGFPAPPEWTPYIGISAGFDGHMTGRVGDVVNLFFQTDFNYNTTAFRDVSFTFEVSGAPLKGIDMWIGGSGTRNVDEVVYQNSNLTGPLAELYVDQDTPSASIRIVPNTPKTVYIFKDISLEGRPGARSTMSEFSQSFDTVPEPLAMLLVGSGLLGLALLRRHRRS